MLKYKGNGSNVGDTSKMSSEEFSVRAKRGVLNNRDADSYKAPAKTKQQGISK